MSRQDAREHHIALMNIRPQPVDIDVPFQLNLCHLLAPVRAVRDLRRASAHSLYTHESTGSQLSMLRSKSAWVSESRYRPFCSERCRQMDLGAWAAEKYTIEGNPEDVPSHQDSNNHSDTEQ